MNAETELLKKHVVMDRIEFELSRDASQKRAFDEYAKEWWSEYRDIRDSHRKREVPIFVETDDRDWM